MRSPGSATPPDASSAIHREFLQLALLIVAAVAAFLLTRAVAANNRQMALHDAAEWYQRGQRQMAAGDVAAAVDSFRRATVKKRGDRSYVLAFARALAAHGQQTLARNALLGARERAPEDPEINLQLARLAAARGDLAEAVRFYHNAVYAPWGADQVDARRAVRLELVRFLVQRGETARALPELIAISTDTPNRPEARAEVGALFASAGEPRRALEQFERALALDPDNGAALAGAGRAAFELGDYIRARRYLRRAPETAEGIPELRAVADLVVTNDPLARRIGSAEQRRRVVVIVTYAVDRLNACVASAPAADVSATLVPLQQQAEAFKAELKPRRMRDLETIENAVDLVHRIEQAISAVCAPATPMDRALALIGSRSGEDER